MPYTHYWRRSPELPEGLFRRAAKDVRAIIEAVEEQGIPIAGPLGAGKPQISNQFIAFNGVENCGHPYKDLGYPYPAPTASGVSLGHPVIVGTHDAGPRLASRTCGGSCAGRYPMGVFKFERVFMVREWDQLEKGRYFQFCETDFKPYDVAVTAVLIQLKELFPEHLFITSDGTEDQWEEGKRVCRQLFGYAKAFVLEPPESEDV